MYTYRNINDIDIGWSYIYDRYFFVKLIASMKGASTILLLTIAKTMGVVIEGDKWYVVDIDALYYVLCIIIRLKYSFLVSQWLVHE